MRICYLPLLFLVIACNADPGNSANTTEPSQPPRFVSLDYCADQYALKFLPREQILALSPDAEKYFSYMRESAAGIPSVRAEAEAVLALKPDKIIRSYGGNANLINLLNDLNIQTIQLPYVTNLTELHKSIKTVSASLGQAARGEQLLVEMDERLSALGTAAANESTLYMTPGGVTSGPGSMAHEIIRHAGLLNYEQRPGWHELPLEQIVLSKPERIVYATFGDPDSHVDSWTLARHPVARRLLQEHPITRIEGAWTACAAWYVLDAIEAVSADAQAAVAIP